MSTVAPIFNRELREAGVRKVRHVAPAGAHVHGAELLRLFGDELLALAEVDHATDATGDPTGTDQ